MVAMIQFVVVLHMEKKGENERYLLDDEGNKTDEVYEAYYEKIDGEELAEEIPELTEEEKEELRVIESVRIYACTHCLCTLDGDNC